MLRRLRLVGRNDGNSLFKTNRPNNSKIRIYPQTNILQSQSFGLSKCWFDGKLTVQELLDDKVLIGTFEKWIKECLGDSESSSE